MLQLVDLRSGDARAVHATGSLRALQSVVVRGEGGGQPAQFFVAIPEIERSSSRGREAMTLREAGARLCVITALEQPHPFVEKRLRAAAPLPAVCARVEGLREERDGQEERGALHSKAFLILLFPSRKAHEPRVRRG